MSPGGTAECPEKHAWRSGSVVPLGLRGCIPINALARELAYIFAKDQTSKAHADEFAQKLTQKSIIGLSILAQEFPDIHLVILVDQFEEIYAPNVDETERRHFIRNLFYFAEDPRGNVSVVLVMRSDFLAQTQHHSELNATIANSGNHVMVPVMNPQELRAVIQEPAKRAGYLFEAPVLDDLLNQTQDREGVLPLLEFTLTRLWEGIKAGVKPAATLTKIGGVGGALAGEAQRLLERLSPADQIIARRAFLAMINLGEGSRDTRRRIQVSDIVASQEDRQHVYDILSRFSQPGVRLITLAADQESKEIAEVAHEALFGYWGTLKDWLDESREDLRFHRRLADAANHWDVQHRHVGSLWRSPNLDLLRDFHDRNKQDMTKVQVDFFNVSERSHKWRQRFKWGAGIILVVITLISSIVGWRAYQESIQTKLAQMEDSHRRSQTLFRSARSKLEALLEGVKAAKLLQNINVETKRREEILTNFREIVYSIKEKNRFGGKDTAVFDVAFVGGEKNAMFDVVSSHDFDNKFDEKLFANQNNGIGFWNMAGDYKDMADSPDFEHDLQVMTISFSPNEKLMASGSIDSTIKLWNVADRKVIKTLEGHENMVYSTAFSPDGRLLASGSWDNTVKLWDVDTGSVVETFEGHEDSVMEIAFSPDGKFLASVSLDKKLILWDVHNRRRFAVLRAEDQAQLFSVAFSLDGKQLASGGMDRKVRFWSVPAGELKHELIMPRSHWLVFQVRFSPDGKTIATGSIDSTIRLWDIATQKQIKVFRGMGTVIQAVAFNSQGTLMASGGLDTSIALWDTTDKNRNGKWTLSDQETPQPVQSVAFNPNGALLASGTEEDHTITIRNAADGKKLSALSGHEGQIESVAFSPDGTLLASGSSDATVKLWNVDDWSELRTFSGHIDLISCVAFSPDSARLVSGSEDNTLKLWNVSNGQEIRTFAGHAEPVTGVAFSPDGTRLASASFDGTLKLWDVSTGNEIKTLSGHDEPVYSVVFSLDGKLIASGSGDKSIKIWDVSTGKELPDFSLDLTGNIGWDSPVRSLAFSPDGTLLAAGNKENLISFWKIATGQRVMTFEGHSGVINSLVFSPDGTRLASGSQDATIKIWDMTWNTAGLESLLYDGCTWMKNYLQHNPNVSKEDRKVCDDILASSSEVSGDSKK